MLCPVGLGALLPPVGLPACPAPQLSTSFGVQGVASEAEDVVFGCYVWTGRVSDFFSLVKPLAVAKSDKSA